MFILAEVKTKDGDEFHTRLFNCSWETFHRIVDRRFVAVGKVLAIDDVSLILAKLYGFTEK